MAKVMSSYENIGSVLIDKTARITDALKPVLHLFAEPEVGLMDQGCSYQGCSYQVCLRASSGNIGHKAAETLLKAAKDNHGELRIWTTMHGELPVLCAQIVKPVGPV